MAESALPDPVRRPRHDIGSPSRQSATPSGTGCGGSVALGSPLCRVPSILVSGLDRETVQRLKDGPAPTGALGATGGRGTWSAR